MTFDTRPSGSRSTPHPITQTLDLVARAQAGENQALNQLIDRYYERVRRVVRVRLGGALRGHVESGDILQETFIAAVGAFDRFEMRDESSLIHWLSRIAENRIRAVADYHGAKKRDHRREVALDVRTEGQSRSDQVAEPAAEYSAPMDGLVREEDIGQVEACMDLLRPEYRDVILHRDYAGATWDVIAGWMESPSPDAARMLYARAITELTSLVHKRTT